MKINLNHRLSEIAESHAETVSSGTKSVVVILAKFPRELIPLILENARVILEMTTRGFE